MLGMTYADQQAQSASYKGYIAENFVQTELCARVGHPTYGWMQARKKLSRWVRFRDCLVYNPLIVNNSWGREKPMTDSTERPTPNIGTLSPVNIREIWPKEDQDFTPWLADQAGLLGEKIGMDLKHEETEAPVGRYSADLVFTEERSNRRVVVENMFGSTDHDHLGKLLTYAAGLDAGCVVLIAEEFKDEHRAALNHLNSISTDEFSFFGIALEAWRIGESIPAPQLRVEVMPDNWARTLKDVHNGRLEPRQQLYRQFWGEFLPAFRAAHPNWTRRTRPSKDNWMNFPSRLSGMLTYTTAFTGDGRLRVEAYIDNEDHTLVEEAHQRLQERAKEVEDRVGEELKWADQRPSTRASRISLYFPHPLRVDDEQSWPEAQAWAVEAMGRMRDAFNPLWQKLELPK